MLFSDGRSIAGALCNLNMKFDGKTQEAAGANTALWDVIRHGLQVDGVYYADYISGSSSLCMLGEYAATHDENSHELRTSTPQDKIRLAMRKSMIL